jgi:hypothetical protein
MVATILESRQRRPDNVHSPHQFVGPSVGVDAINHQRNDRESLQPRTAVDVKPPQPVQNTGHRAFCLWDLLDEHLAQARYGNLFGAHDEQIRLPRDSSAPAGDGHGRSND